MSNVIAVFLHGCGSQRMKEMKMRSNVIPYSTCAYVGFWKSIGVCVCPMEKCSGEPTLRPLESSVVKERRWIWIEHVLRMDNSSLPLPYGEKELIMMMMMKNFLNSLFWHTGEVGEQQDWFLEEGCRRSAIVVFSLIRSLNWFCFSYFQVFFFQFPTVFLPYFC